MDTNSTGKDINRSSSAPPTQLMQPLEPSKLLPEDFDGSATDPRLDPEYAQYYYMHSRLDPRLPPPIYTPGQSWQMWASQPAVGKGNVRGEDLKGKGAADGVG